MSVDVLRKRRDVTDARRTFEGLRRFPAALEPAVGASWQRCVESLSVECSAPASPVDTRAIWGESPIRRMATGVIDTIADLACSEGYIAAITDASGNIIWSASDLASLRLADKANFIEGTNWSEDVAGTNAPALALRNRRPATVFGAEHWATSVQNWVCYAAPINSPDGTLLGALDLSASWRNASPLAQSTVWSMATLIERELERTPARQQAGAHFRACGPHGATFAGADVNLSLRQAEILTVLATHGAVSLDRLHDLLYGDRPVSASTLKAEVSHLRRALGGAIASRPYRIDCPFTSDIGCTIERIETGDLCGALDCYRVPLLPSSESPFVIDLRHRIEAQLRAMVLERHDVSAVRSFLQVNPYDVTVIEHGLMIPSSSRQDIAALQCRLDAATA